MANNPKKIRNAKDLCELNRESTPPLLKLLQKRKLVLKKQLDTQEEQINWIKQYWKLFCLNL